MPRQRYVSTLLYIAPLGLRRSAYEYYFFQKKPKLYKFKSPPPTSSSSSRNGPRSFHRGTSLHSAQNNETSNTLPSTSETESPIRNTVMAITVLRGKLGCAVYDPDVCKMMLLEDVPVHTSTSNKIVDRFVDQSELNEEETEETSSSFSKRSKIDATAESSSSELINLLSKRYKPQLILINANIDEEIKGTLKKQASHDRFILQVRPEDDFRALFCKSVVQQLEIPVLSLGSAINNTENNNSHASLALLDLYPLSTASSAAIMCHIQRTNTLNENDPEAEGYQESVILALEIFGLSNSMIVDPDTAKALSIFDRENHATVFSSRTKEGLSLFSLFSTALSRRAKALLTQWLSFPSMDFEILNARLDTVEFFVDSRNASLTSMLHKDIKGMKNICTLSSALISDKATVTTWKGIAEFSSKAVQIGMTCQANMFQGNASIVDRVRNTFDTEKLTFVYESIGAIIDWEESALVGRVAVKRGLDSDLDEWRKTLVNLPAFLETMSFRFVESLDVEFISDYNVAIEYFPQIGFLISLNRKDGFAIDHTSVNAGKDENWKYQYSSEVKAYFKNDAVKELDEEIGDLHSLIAGREIEIVQRLQAEVTRQVSMLIKCGDLLAEIECLLTFAHVAVQNRYIRPELLNQPIVDIEDGRHPLQELIVDTFVPNACTLVGGQGINEEGSLNEREKNDHNSIIIITGANACGKSTYLRQIAMIVVMAQIGSFVPVRHACIGMVDKILTRIQVDESISSSKGSFQTDMEQVANALNRSTPNSLLLFDEMCKGTLQTDGVALFAAIIRHLLRRGDCCPRVLAATHFHEVFHENLLDPSMPITPAHMQIMLDKEAENGNENEDGEPNVVFLYKLKPGLELVSHAAQCAKLCGVPQPIIDRANYVANLSKNHELKSLELSIIEDLAEAEIMDDQKYLNSSETGTAKHKQTYTLEQAEQVMRAFVAWNIDADKQAASEEGEMAYLDPIVKLTRIMNAPFTIKTISTDPVSAIDVSESSGFMKTQSKSR